MLERGDGEEMNEECDRLLAHIRSWLLNAVCVQQSLGSAIVVAISRPQTNKPAMGFYCCITLRDHKQRD